MKGKVVAPQGAGYIKLGFGRVGIIDNKYKRTLWENNGEIVFGKHVFLGAGTKIACSGVLSFGDDCFINGNTDIICEKEMMFGERSLVSWECLFMDTDFHSLRICGEDKIVNPDKTVSIGNHTWVGARCTFLKGATIPDESVVAACSIINYVASEQHCVYSTHGVIKRNIEW